MGPKQIIEDALRAKLVDEDGNPVELELLPPLSSQELEELSASVPCEMPEAVVDLLQFCRGFYGSAADVVDFSGRDCPFEHLELFPYGLPIAADGYGNFWVVDLAPEAKDWAPIYFACHDPPIVLYQSPNLSHFLDGLFALSTPPHSSPVDDVHEDRVFEVWRKNPSALTQSDCIESADREIADFAQGLDSSWQIIDLRDAEVGFGFSWGRYGPNTEIRRMGTKPLFAYRRPPGILERLLRRR